MRATLRSVERVISGFHRNRQRHWFQRDSGSLVVLAMTSAGTLAAVIEWVV